MNNLVIFYEIVIHIVPIHRPQKCTYYIKSTASLSLRKLLKLKIYVLSKTYLHVCVQVFFSVFWDQNSI